MRRRTQGYVEKMKERPRHEQQRHAFGVATGITVALFLFWLPLFVFKIQSHEEGKVAEREGTFEVFKSGAASVVNGLGESVDVLRGQAHEYSSVEYQAPANDDVPFGPALEPVETEVVITGEIEE